MTEEAAQRPPGSEEAMRRKPDHGERTYRDLDVGDPLGVSMPAAVTTPASGGKLRRVLYGCRTAQRRIEGVGRRRRDWLAA